MAPMVVLRSDVQYTMRTRSLTIGAAGLALALTAGVYATGDAASWSILRSGTGQGARSLLSALLSSVSASDDDTSGPSEVHLRVPPHEPLLIKATPPLPPKVAQGERRAHAYQYTSRVFSRPHKKPFAIGYVRRGMVLHAVDRVPGSGCSGTWYKLDTQGVVCDRDGFSVAREPRELPEQRTPNVRRALPFRYAKVKSHDALRFFRIPSVEEEAAIVNALELDTELPEVVDTKLDGVYLLALDRTEQADGRTFVRTVRGRYVKKSDLEPKPEPRMRGVVLREGRTLPYAFVYGAKEDKAPVFRLDEDGSLKRAGIADHHAHLKVARESKVDGKPVVVGDNGLVLERSRVRLARKHKRPSDVPRNAQWIHVDLTEQVLVAYEGDAPVFVTLVSSGKGKKHATPTGLYRVHEKHISTTMSGPDPDEGVYEVEEVPWTLFYHDSYALHGAYWHDEFGKTRSHGCTNISPVDARWLFYWSDGSLPAGWNAVRGIDGPWVYFTGDASSDV